MSGGDFWSRRKAAVAAEEAQEADAQEAQELAEEHAALETLSDEELLEKLDLPDPDTLTQGDDFSVFLAQAVPEHLRRRALRKLWTTNPVLANLDTLVDYGEDFTDSAMVVENLQTAYQVGKGMLKHVEELARQAAEQSDPSDSVEEPAQDVAVSDDALIADSAETAEAMDPAVVVADAQSPVETAEEEGDSPAPTRSRMRIRFDQFDPQAPDAPIPHTV